jgi:hypothetical protein
MYQFDKLLLYIFISYKMAAAAAPPPHHQHPHRGPPPLGKVVTFRSEVIFSLLRIRDPVFFAVLRIRFLT